MSLETTPTAPTADSYVTLAEANAIVANRADVTDWDALTNDQKEAVLKQATQQIDSMRFFHGKYVPQPQWYRDKQALTFPWARAEAASGRADSGTTTTMTDNALANLTNRPDDYWNGGAIIITEGTNKGLTRKITDFVMSTGVVTFDAFPSAIDSTSTYVLVAAVPIEVKQATVEQAISITRGAGRRAQLRAEGVKRYRIDDVEEEFFGGGGQAAGAPISGEARGILRGFVSRIGRLKA